MVRKAKVFLTMDLLAEGGTAAALAAAAAAAVLGWTVRGGAVEGDPRLGAENIFPCVAMYGLFARRMGWEGFER